MTIPFTDETSESSDCGVSRDNEKHHYELSYSPESDLQLISHNLLNIDLNTLMHSYEKCKKSLLVWYTLALFIKLFVKCIFNALINDTMIRKCGHTVKLKVKWKRTLLTNEQLYLGPKRWLGNIIRPIRNIPQTIIQTFPFLPQDFRIFLKDEKSQFMQFEGSRFSTFSTFPYIPGVYATRLAEAGFFYSGYDDEVVCYSCGVTHKNWKRYDSPLEIHKQISPNCYFILEIKPQREESSQTAGACGRDEIEPDSRAFISDDKSFHTSSKSKDEKRESREYNASCSNQTSSCNVNIMRTESNSFATRYSTNDTQSLIRIPEFNAHTQHAILNSTGSIIHGVYAKSTLQNNQREPTALGTCLDKSKYPKYTIRSVRLDSFSHWPQHLTQSPEEMAAAGFFFTGTDDHCRCFFCGGGLRSWKPGDQPWIEHARWYQNCTFLRQCKGDKFIEDVQMNRILPQENENNWHPNSEGETRKSVTKNAEYSNHPAVMAVADLGYDERIVKKAYDSLQNAKSTEITGTVLLEAIFQIEEKSRINESLNSIETGQLSGNDTQQTKEDNPKEAIENKSTEETTSNPDLELSVRSLEEEKKKPERSADM
ncbi:unnamed protein product [Mytilus coruscus]|uniref:BIRC7_8 n=1 Tax=Mytilus coruscus TaxID=42192 RepID=A0A6J8B8D8_MYTCO|nr:unnamed protein product [Mytilus coruscus]